MEKLQGLNDRQYNPVLPVAAFHYGKASNAQSQIAPEPRHAVSPLANRLDSMRGPDDDPPDPPPKKDQEIPD